MRRKLEFAVSKSEKDIRFANGLTIITFTLTVGLILLFLYPEHRLSAELSNLEHSSAITANYLRILLEKEPNNNQIRYLYAQQLVQLHEFSRAQPEIQKLYASNPLNQQKAILLNYEIERATVYATPLKSPEYENKKKMLQELLLKMNHQNPSLKQLIILLEDASFLQEKSMGAIFLQKLDSLKKYVSAQDAAKIAVSALALGDYQASATYYFLAQQKSTSFAKKKEYFIAALRSLEMGNQSKLAVEWGKKNLGILKNDRDALNYLTKLALQVKEFDAAQESISQSIGLEYKK